MNIHDNRRRFQNSQIGLARPAMTATRSATDFEIMQQEHIEQMRAEIERKNKLIEQMREALERLSNAATAVNQQRHDNPDPVPMFVAMGEMLSAIKQANDAIKAAKGEV